MKILRLQIESLLLEKKHIIQCMIRDENLGGWRSDYNDWMREINIKIDKLIEKMQEKNEVAE